MFGPFRATSPTLGGLLWKVPWRMTPTQKAGQRKRLQQVDSVIAEVRKGLESVNASCKALAIAEANTPKESEMLPRDKYTTFSPHHRGYRKGAHRIPKWTKITNRINPKGF